MGNVNPTDNASMTNPVKNHQNKIMFIGLTNNEKINIEVAFQKYNTNYSSEVPSDSLLLEHDLICITEDLYQEKMLIFDIPIFIVGSVDIDGTSGLLPRPIYVSEWLKFISQVLPPVRRPEVKRIEIGSIVRSKTTPAFGKGVVIDVVSETDVIVKFPLNKLLPKNQSLRCHCSQLQLLGNINDYHKNG